MPKHSKYLIIGAGPCGLALAKAFKSKGIKYHQAEATSKIGGNWSHGVYDTVFTDASKQVMQFSDYPMPESYPHFLSKKHMLDYLNSYCEYFKLEEHILFNTKVTWLQADGNEWVATFNEQHQERYTGVVVCNGHHWDMKFPSLNGYFEGEYVHSKEYKNPAQLTGKRVLVIGAGNSAADIACEAARVGASSTMSIRNSPWVFPKTFAGVPLGNIKLRKAPSFLNPILLKLLIKFTFGKHEYYGLETPSHGYFDKHPTVSEELPYYLKHGRINLQKGIDKIVGNTVTFTDGQADEYDLIVAATGYHLSFPFFPEALQRVEGQHLKCVGYCTYPDYKGLYMVGWPQVRGGIGSLASAFSQVVTDLVAIEEEFGVPAGQVLEACGNKACDTHLYGSKDVFEWIQKHPLHKLKKVARRMTSFQGHVNKSTASFEPPDKKLVNAQVAHG